MITCEQFYAQTKQHDLLLYAGVPDSTFKEWLQFLDEAPADLRHIAVSNEGDAVSLVSGYYLGSRRIGVVYMQNSGLGNTVNPITSLADRDVYSIPMILMIGWRGMPGMKDEPQHKKMGRITLPMLDTLEIPYAMVPEQPEELQNVFDQAVQWVQKNNGPYALVVRHGTFAPYQSKKTLQQPWTLCREDAVKMVAEALRNHQAIVATTGKISRELYEYRDALQQGHSQDFYTVGSLGCCVSIAMGIALTQPQRDLVVFDADGSALMHLGSWATVGAYHPTNLKHIIFDNETYESTGAQPCHSKGVSFPEIAKACGYQYTKQVTSQEQLQQTLPSFLQSSGPSLLVIKVQSGSRSNLGRPKTSPLENKSAFMDFLQK